MCKFMSGFNVINYYILNPAQSINQSSYLILRPIRSYSPGAPAHHFPMVVGAYANYYYCAVVKVCECDALSHFKLSQLLV